MISSRFFQSKVLMSFFIFFSPLMFAENCFSQSPVKSERPNPASRALIRKTDFKSKDRNKIRAFLIHSDLVDQNPDFQTSGGVSNGSPVTNINLSWRFLGNELNKRSAPMGIGWFLEMGLGGRYQKNSTQGADGEALVLDIYDQGSYLGSKDIEYSRVEGILEAEGRIALGIKLGLIRVKGRDLISLTGTGYLKANSYHYGNFVLPVTCETNPCAVELSELDGYDDYSDFENLFENTIQEEKRGFKNPALSYGYYAQVEIQPTSTFGVYFRPRQTIFNQNKVFKGPHNPLSHESKYGVIGLKFRITN